MQIIQLQPDEIKESEHNSNMHPASQIKKLVKSIKKFGFNVPVLIDKNNVLIAGGGRLMAAKKMMLKSLPAIRIEHLSEAEKRAYMIADNRIAHDSGFDMEVVAQEYKFLLDEGEDLIDSIGLETFDMSRIESILNFEETDQYREDVAEGKREKDDIEEDDQGAIEESGAGKILGDDVENTFGSDEDDEGGYPVRPDETEELPKNMPDMEQEGLDVRPYKMLSFYIYDVESYEKLKEFMADNGGFKYLNESSIVYPSRELDAGQTVN